MINKKISAISVALLLFAFPADSRSQKPEEGSAGIGTTILVSRQRVLPYESLSVALVLRNETTEDKRVMASWCSFLSIGEVISGATKWRGYRADNEPLLKPCLSSSKNLAPDESRNMPGHVDYEAPSGEHVFSRPGKYLLKEGTTDGRFLSDEVQITVQTPKGLDAKAYEFLRTTDLHHFFGEYTVLKYRYDGKTVQEMEKFIGEFDGSQYSYLARMGLAFMWLRGVEGRQNQDRAIELLTKVADNAGDPLSSAAEYHLGAILNRQRNTAQANYHFQRVLGGTPPLYFKYLAEQALRGR